MPGVKVDRYRFMTFYLDGSERNFDEFFNHVVDPEWLASNDEEARAAADDGGNQGLALACDAPGDAGRETGPVGL